MVDDFARWRNSNGNFLSKQSALPVQFCDQQEHAYLARFDLIHEVGAESWRILHCLNCDTPVCAFSVALPSPVLPVDSALIPSRSILLLNSSQVLMVG